MTKLIFDSGRPIYTQLVEALTLRIVAGDYAPGQRLPAVRELALTLEVNPNTMQRAMTQLEQDGLVCAQRTAGRFVTEDTGRIAQVRTALAAQKVRVFRDEMRALRYTDAELLALLQKEENTHE